MQFLMISKEWLNTFFHRNCHCLSRITKGKEILITYVEIVIKHFFTQGDQILRNENKWNEIQFNFSRH